MNHVMIHGRVYKEPWYRAGDAGGKRSVLSVTVEVEDRQRTQRFDCYLFGEEADAHALAFSEGDWVFATGQATLDTYNKDYPKLKVYTGSINKTTSASSVAEVDAAIRGTIQESAEDDDLDF